MLHPKILLHHLHFLHTCKCRCKSLPLKVVFPYVFLDAMNAFSRCEVPSPLATIISYAMTNPCNSSLLIFFRFALYSNTNTFGLNLPRKVLRIFHIIVFSSIGSPNPYRLLVISSMCWKYATMPSSSFILSFSNFPL